MTWFINLAIFTAAIGLAAYSIYRDGKHPIWNRLVSIYRKSDRKPVENGNSHIEMVFFWDQDRPDDYDYFNALKVNVSSGGVAVLPVLVHPTVPPILIPWERLEFIGTRKFDLMDRLVVKCKETSIHLAIQGRWKRQIESYISLKVEVSSE